MVTSFGTVKALFIFIDFSDDNNDPNNTTWPVGTGPNFLNDIVDLTENQNSGTYANVSTFFKDMSYGQFKMIGKAYYVQAPHTLSWYQTNHSGSEAAYSAQDAIQILDQTVDFADFDRWTDSEYNHTEGPDGTLEMVFICYRIWYTGSSFLSEGWWGASLPGDVSVDNDARSIVSSHGVDVLRMIQYPRFEHVVHEFGHVWGLNHQYSRGLWSLMGTRRPNNGSFMNSFEREQLGWIAYHDISTPQTAPLRDFGTERDAYRLSLGSGEYFLLENHQRVSPYDDPDITGAKGLFVLRQYTSAIQCVEASLKVEAADGRFDWSIPHWTIFPNTNVNVPVFKRESSLRYSGKNDKDLWYLADPNTQNWNCYDVIAKIDEFTGQEVYGSFYKGDGRDGFNLGYNTVFSPWSNPSASKQNGTLSSVGFEVLQSSDDVFDVQFFIGNPENASPSKPQDLRVTVYQPNPWVRILRLTWAANLEDDVINGGSFQIYRRIRDHRVYPITWTAWSYLTAVPGSQTQYDDNSIAGAGTGTDSVQYYIQAKDNTNKTSVPSDFAAINFTAGVEKNGNPEGPTPPTVFMLVQNYPNPFNPSTILKYQLAEDGFVSLKVFDVLGKEVATLVSGEHVTGYYSATFGGQDVSSGIYFARFVVTGALGEVKYSKMTKLVLMK